MILPIAEAIGLVLFGAAGGWAWLYIAAARRAQTRCIWCGKRKENARAKRCNACIISSLDDAAGPEDWPRDEDGTFHQRERRQ